VDDTGLAELERWPALHHLGFIEAPLPPRAAEHIARCRSLGELNLGNSDCNDADLAQLTSLPLAHLFLQNTRITNAGLMKLAGVKTLRSLYINGTKVTTGGVAAFKKERPDCKVVAENLAE
jgi:hypothetical protein